MRKRSQGAGGWTTTVPSFLFMRDFSTFPRGLGKSSEKSESRKNPPLGNLGLVGFDLDWAGLARLWRAWTCCWSPAWRERPWR